MKIKSNVNVINFLSAVSQCHSDVYFITEEGDNLNLKSTLSQFIFTSVLANAEILENAHIECHNPDDFDRLKDFTVR